MHDADGLFPDPRPVQPPQERTETEELPDWQLTSLRKALDNLELVTVTERQKAVEGLAGRPLASLRDLTFIEAREILEQLTARQTPTNHVGSAWDDREEDTWIDRL